LSVSYNCNKFLMMRVIQRTSKRWVYEDEGWDDVDTLSAAALVSVLFESVDPDLLLLWRPYCTRLISCECEKDYTLLCFCGSEIQ
jgi:hypothetical protein